VAEGEGFGMNWLRSVLLPTAGSPHAADHDAAFMFLVLLSTFFFLLIAGLIAWFVWKYRRRGPGERTPRITQHLGLEIAWTLIPLAIAMGLFFWGFHDYMQASIAPSDAIEIQVTAKKWIWQFEYPGGIRTLNELHVPLGRPVKLIMSSEDVIHSFFVPSFRVKQDVLPNRYTEMWFQPTEAGVHQVFCAEYCGTGHSDMLARIVVEDDAKYQNWLETGGDEGKSMPLKEFGALLYESRGCATCHSLDGMRGQGPSFKGVFGHTVELAAGKSVLADENYIRESILDPQAKVVKGFEPIMPTFQGLLRQREMNALVEFIKAQK
jgi:cytochrome c oxidase subunit 2